jgi:hypothetical protein
MFPTDWPTAFFFLVLVAPGLWFDLLSADAEHQFANLRFAKWFGSSWRAYSLVC